VTVYAWGFLVAFAAILALLIPVLVILRRQGRSLKQAWSARDFARVMLDDTRRRAELDRGEANADRFVLRDRVRRLEEWQQWILSDHPAADRHLDRYARDFDDETLFLAERLDDNGRGESS
jgi:hypothetical protein